MANISETIATTKANVTQNTQDDSLYEVNYFGSGIATVKAKGDWVERITEYDYKMGLNDRKETRRHIYFSNLPFGAEQFVGYEPDPLDAVCMMETNVELIRFLDTLTSRQSEVLRKRLDGMCSSAIARQEGVTRAAIHEVIVQIRKKFANDTLQNAIPVANR